MTPEKALNIALETLEKFEFVPEAYDNQYTKLCATALEKQMPKKAVDIFSYSIDEGVFKFGRCPICGFGIAYDSTHNFCPNCGQKLDWTEEKENNK